MFHGHLEYFQKPPLGGRPTRKPGDHGTSNAHNRWFILLYHAWGPAWIEIHWNDIWLRAQSHTTSHDTWGSVTTPTWVWRCLGTAFGHFHLGSHTYYGHGSCLVCEAALILRGRVGDKSIRQPFACEYFNHKSKFVFGQWISFPLYPDPCPTVTLGNSNLSTRYVLFESESESELLHFRLRNNCRIPFPSYLEQRIPST